MNKKKHSKLKSYSKKISLIGCLFMFSCVPKSTQDVVLPPQPVKRESVVPYIKTVDGGITNTIDSNSKISDKVKSQKEEVLKQKLSISEAIVQAEKLREKAKANELITEIEMINIIDSLKRIETRNLFLEKQNEELNVLTNGQSDILKKLKADILLTQTKMMEKENEADSLRSHNTFLENSLKNKSLELSKLEKLLEKEKIKSANATVYKHWIIGLVSVFIGWIIIKNILMIYFPATKFRI